ncbi:hypothetical protein J4225_05270 [Candidatus Pacearchaeota archaeon]|nr:hypothetical protein [Candidatus Pacearchaeota archaeon]
MVCPKIFSDEGKLEESVKEQILDGRFNFEDNLYILDKEEAVKSMVDLPNRLVYEIVIMRYIPQLNNYLTIASFIRHLGTKKIVPIYNTLEALEIIPRDILVAVNVALKESVKKGPKIQELINAQYTPEPLN